MIIDTKEKILRACAALFYKKGFDSTSVSEIIQEISISKGTLYYHFPSKQKMLFEVVSRGMSLTILHVRPLFNSELGLRDKLREFTKCHIINTLENIEFVAVAFRERDRLEEQYRIQYTKLRDEHQSMFEEIIRSGINQGIFPPANLKLTTYAILDICNGPVRWYKPQGSLKPEEIATEYSTLICDYMLRNLDTQDTDNNTFSR